MSESTKMTHKLPRVAITYCTQCRWMLRAAYFGQELLSTFGTSIGEIAFIPATGGIFQVHLTYIPADASQSGDASTIDLKEVLLWDRKAEGGFPETKILKQRVRNHIEPGKDLGHSDKPSSKDSVKNEGASASVHEKVVPAPDLAKVAADEDSAQKPREDCEDCR